MTAIQIENIASTKPDGISDDIAMIKSAAAPALKVAIVHYWLVGIGGGEKVIEALMEIFPQAEIFTLLQKPVVARKVVGSAKVHASFLQKIPFATRFHRKLLPLMPVALENLNLDGFDLIISSESGPAKGVLPPLGALHICYCHSPMRYVWDQFHEYRESSGKLSRLIMSITIPRLRLWDFVSSARVDHFVANSMHVQSRIGQYYRRPSEVIHPPVDTDSLHISENIGDYFLITGRHVAYKRIDLAIEACNALGKSLIITGEGPETARLKKMAGDTIKFVGRCSLLQLRVYYAECRAFLMPGEEDFGIAPVEAMASGRPVIALARGGALDSVVEGLSGLLFREASKDGLMDAIRQFEAIESRFDPKAISEHASKFSKSTFTRRFSNFVGQKLAERQFDRRPTIGE